MDKPLKKRHKHLRLKPKNIKVERLANDIYRAAASFDLSSVPDNIEIESAKLQIPSGDK